MIGKIFILLWGNDILCDKVDGKVQHVAKIYSKRWNPIEF